MEAIIQEIKAALEAADPNITVVEVKRAAAEHSHSSLDWGPGIVRRLSCFVRSEPSDSEVSPIALASGLAAVATARVGSG